MNTSDTIKDVCGSVNPRPRDLTLEEKKLAHKLGILEYHHETTDGPWYVARGWREFEFSEFQWRFRITPGKEHLLDKKESEKTMEKYEYLTADSADNCHKILDWSFSPGVEIKINGEWADHFDGVRRGYRYRRKNQSPPKVKKLVNREQKDFWPLIGRYWAKDSDGRRYLIFNDTWHSCAIQECWQIAPLGSEDFLPMQKEIEVEGC